MKTLTKVIIDTYYTEKLVSFLIITSTHNQKICIKDYKRGVKSAGHKMMVITKNKVYNTECQSQLSFKTNISVYIGMKNREYQ